MVIRFFFSSTISFCRPQIDYVIKVVDERVLSPELQLVLKSPLGITVKLPAAQPGAPQRKRCSNPVLLGVR